MKATEWRRSLADGPEGGGVTPVRGTEVPETHLSVVIGGEL